MRIGVLLFVFVRTFGAIRLVAGNRELDEDLFNKLCPTADDVWIWAMAVLNGTRIKGVKNSYTKLTYVNLARELNMLNQKTLYSVNKMTGNNQQVENVLFEFPKILENIVKNEHCECDIKEKNELLEKEYLCFLETLKLNKKD